MQTRPWRTVLIGGVTFSRTCLATLQEIDEIALAGVVTRPSRPPGDGDRVPLGHDTRALGLPVCEVRGRGDAAIASFLRVQGAELALCLGWNHLLGRPVLDAVPRGVVGYHPAELPRNRGRHPIVWALALGLEQTGSTFLLLDEGADTGPILDQRPVAILDEDDAGSLYARLADVAQTQLRELLPRLVRGEVVPRAQDRAQGNVWRRRGRADGRIDWRMPARGIRNLVRALAPPYPGAHVETADGPVAVRRADLGWPAPRNLEPGRVLASGPEGIRVQTGDGTVWLREHGFAEPPPAGGCL